MKKQYDYEKQTFTYVCGNCKHSFVEEAGNTCPNENRFLKLGKTTITKNEYSYYERLEEIQLYACPKCGCIQVEV